MSTFPWDISLMVFALLAFVSYIIVVILRMDD